MEPEITWIIHAVCNDTQIASHTHGLDQYGSLELELNLSAPKKKIMQIINVIGLEIASGHKYKSGDSDSELFNMPFYLLETTPIFGSEGPDGRVLRIILPDPAGLYPWNANCVDGYRAQLSESEIIHMLTHLGRGPLS